MRVPAREPSLEAFSNPLLRRLSATRPAFVTISLAGCVLGFATAVADGNAFAPARAAATLGLIVLAHAGINVLNDYCDHLNGSDARNTGRIYPFTGGSRFIQNGVLSPRETLTLAVVLFALTVAGGVGLVAATGPGLVWIGLAGLAIGWAYSAPPLRLNSRGFGELSVATGMALVVVGADYVQRGGFAALPVWSAVPFGLFVANVLYINQFPDRDADRASGKLHWVARLSPAAGVHGYAAILALAALALGGGIVAGALPAAAAVACVAWIPAVVAWRQLRRHAHDPARLAPAIRLTLGAAHVLPLVLAAILLLSKSFLASSATLTGPLP